MRRRTKMRPRNVSLILLLLAALSGPTSNTALSVAASDSEPEPPRRLDGPDVPSVWDPPVATSRPIRPPAPPHVAERAISANPLWAIPLTSLSNTRERPIFSPSRRPPPPPREATVAVVRTPPPKPPPAELQLSLVGTVIGGDQSFGIFIDQATKTALRLRLGDEYQGWHLKSVQGRDVSLERDQQKIVLSLPAPGIEGRAKPVSVQVENANFDDEADPNQRRGRR
jgi:general secretion pathway protein N